MVSSLDLPSQLAATGRFLDEMDDIWTPPPWYDQKGGVLAMGDIVRVVRHGRHIGWYVRYRDIDGKRKQRASHQPTKELARRYLLEVEGRVARGKLGIPEPAPLAPTLAELIERFLGEYSHARIKDLARYRRSGRVALNRAVTVLGNQRIDEVKPADINRLRIALAKRYAARTVRVTLAFLGTVFSFAIRASLCGTSPLRGVEKPPIEELFEYLSKEEIVALLAVGKQQAEGGDLAGKMRYACIHLAIHTGLRKGELFGLRWRDIDLNTLRLTVARSYKSRPKSNKLRHLRLPSVCVPVLAAWSRDCPRTPEGLVFPVIRYGRAIAGNEHHTVGLHELLVDAQARPLSRPWHALRHSFASHFVMAGGNILSLQKILGHSDIKMTLVYAHLAPDFLATEMERLKF